MFARRRKTRGLANHLSDRREVRLRLETMEMKASEAKSGLFGGGKGGFVFKRGAEGKGCLLFPFFER